MPDLYTHLKIYLAHTKILPAYKILYNTALVRYRCRWILLDRFRYMKGP